MNTYILEAHRGVGTEYPENTMPAFRAALEQGYGMIELDPRFTADNRCILHHDRTINRMARRPDGSAVEEPVQVTSLTLAELDEFDYGIAMGEAFRGTKVCRVEEVLAFAAENRIPLKFDNVIQSQTEEQREIFFAAIEASGAGEYAQFTANSTEYIQTLLARFPKAQIHYDGPSSEESLEAISRIVPKDQLTVWLRFDNEITSWNKTPPVSEELSALVKRYGKLGVWILVKESELREAVEKYGADIIETDGTLKPLKG